MPIIKSARKKMKQDKKRAIDNKVALTKLKKALTQAKKTKTAKAINEANRALDLASKKGIIHKNKVARLKSVLAKSQKEEKPVTKAGKKKK